MVLEDYYHFILISKWKITNRQSREEMSVKNYYIFQYFREKVKVRHAVLHAGTFAPSCEESSSITSFLNRSFLVRFLFCLCKNSQIQRRKDGERQKKGGRRWTSLRVNESHPWMQHRLIIEQNLYRNLLRRKIPPSGQTNDNTTKYIQWCLYYIRILWVNT